MSSALVHFYAVFRFSFDYVLLDRWSVRFSGFRLVLCSPSSSHSSARHNSNNLFEPVIFVAQTGSSHKLVGRTTLFGARIRCGADWFDTQLVWLCQYVWFITCWSAVPWFVAPWFDDEPIWFLQSWFVARTTISVATRYGELQAPRQAATSYKCRDERRRATCFATTTISVMTSCREL